MAGTLHIFKRSDTPLEYQANYNLGPASWVKVFDPAEQEHFLHSHTGLPDDEIEAMLAELRDTGRTTEAPVIIPEAHLVELGFRQSPSDD